MTSGADVPGLRPFLIDYKPVELAPLSSLDVPEWLPSGGLASGWPAFIAGRFQETHPGEDLSSPGSVR